MGGLLAFRVNNFDNTAEREQFRFLCSQLSKHYENSNEFCVFAGNYNIGCELDALFIKKDAIIAIEFKNYGGKVIANENGEWTCDGKTIKGGSRKTVLQQARINHSIVKKELKVLGVASHNVKDVPTLIVFNQPIEITNNLCVTNKSWLHITDNEHFLEKIDDITCPHTDLDPLGIVNLAELLNLNSFFLSEFSNATYEKNRDSVEQNVEIIKEKELKKVSVGSNKVDMNLDTSPLLDPSVEGDSTKEECKNQSLHFQTKEELMALRNYAEQIVCAVWGRSDFIINVINYIDFSSNFKEIEPLIKQENIIILEGDYNENEKNHLQRFLNKKIYRISDTSLFWQSGDFVKLHNNLSYNIEESACCAEKKDAVFDSTLPEWIDNLIFNKLGAKYSPDHIRFEYNLDLTKEEVLIYLGTYFPRSYFEVYDLFKELLVGSNYLTVVGSKKSISILDLGCGTGGDIIGLLSFVEDYLPFVESVKVLAIDGNHEALRIFEKVLTAFKRNSRLNIRETIGPVFIEEESDLDLVSRVVSDDYDFILSCKTICEILAKGRLNNHAYKKIVNFLTKKLSLEGILLIEDVTIKIPVLNEFIPNILNRELNEFVNENPRFSTLAPISCKEHGKDCKNGCFYKKEIMLSHSQKSNDLSKIVYRFISHKDFADRISINNKELNNNKCLIF